MQNSELQHDLDQLQWLYNDLANLGARQLTEIDSRLFINMHGLRLLTVLG